jgi:microcystin-dependent protein
MILLFANNAIGSLAAPINAQAIEVQLAAGQGDLFPNPVVGKQYFLMTFVDALTGLVNEIVAVTARSGDVMTIIRGQESTEPLAWLAGDSAVNMTTAGTQGNFAQIQQAQEGAYNFSEDTGTANNYVVELTPVVTERIKGLYVRILAANTNTGPSTLNIGAGSFPILNPDGTELGANAIVAGGIFEVVDDGAVAYQLISASQEAQSTEGLATTGDMKMRPTDETIAGWVVANGTTIGNAASGATQLADPTTENLFAWHWNNFSNTQCPVFTSAGGPTTRGANAAADYAANKSIAVYDKRGKGDIGVDGMGAAVTNRLNGVPVTSGSVTAPGSVIGQNLHTLIQAEMPVHNHAANVSDPTHSHSSNLLIANNSSSSGGGPFPIPANDGVGTINNSGTGISVSINNNGGGGAHNNVMLVDTATYYLKL